jgi:hypothetical protein
LEYGITQLRERKHHFPIVAPYTELFDEAVIAAESTADASPFRIIYSPEYRSITWFDGLQLDHEEYLKSQYEKKSNA